MEDVVVQKFNVIIDKIENKAEKTGNWLKTKINKIIMGVTFSFMVIFFGFIVFSSKFTKSLFGVKD
jgi:hypothetical protein